MLKGNTTVVVLLCLIFGMMTWSRAQESRNGSLTVQDYNEITQLYAKYNHAIDSVDGEAFANLFTADGSVSFIQGSGHDVLVAGVKDHPMPFKRHWNSGLVITPAPGGAKGAVYLLAVNVGVRPPALMSASQYDDTLVKTPQGWRFEKRIVKGDGPTPAGSAASRPAQR